MLQPAVALEGRGVVVAPAAAVVLAREDERGEPEVREGQVERQEVAAVGLERRQEHGEEVEEQGDDGDNLLVDQVRAAGVVAPDEVGEDPRDDGAGCEDEEVVDAQPGAGDRLVEEFSGGVHFVVVVWLFG